MLNCVSEKRKVNRHYPASLESRTIDSPISQMGGKYYLSRWLVEKMPEHTLYCEPFCGGCSVFFAKKPSKVEVLNDINNSLITFFQVLQDKEGRVRLVKILNALPYSRRIFRDISTRWKLGDIPYDNTLRASEWFYLSKACFSGDFYNGGFAVPSTTGRNPCLTFRNTIDSFNVIARRLKCVTFESLDFRECIKRYDSPDTLFFCDPPYITDRDYYGYRFIPDDHADMAELMSSIRGKAMITHYENDFYDKLYANWHRFEYESFKVSYGLNGSKKGNKRPKTCEVLYCNFEMA